MDAEVALRKESVDRNNDRLTNFVSLATSLSARRAWIEIDLHLGGYKQRLVALRKESVDRNIVSFVQHKKTCTSLSARRAWIEIRWQELQASSAKRRSPQGERG